MSGNLNSGRRPLPAWQKRLRGNRGRRPLRDDVPAPALVTTPPAPPGHLGPDAREYWLQLAPHLVESGLLTVLDLPLFELLTTCLGRHRRLSERLAALERDGPTADATANTAALARALRHESVLAKDLAVRFGLDPAARSRIAVRPPAPPDEFAEFDLDAWMKRRAPKARGQR